MTSGRSMVEERLSTLLSLPPGSSWVQVVPNGVEVYLDDAYPDDAWPGVRPLDTPRFDTPQLDTPQLDTSQVDAVRPPDAGAVSAPEPAVRWIAALVHQLDGPPLHDASDAGGLGQALWSSLEQGPSDGSSRSTQEAGPRRTARGLLEMAGGLQRLIGWAQATQVQVLAALGRPGDAVPLGDVLAAVTTAVAATSLGAGAAEALCDRDFDAVRYSETGVHGDPVWDVAVAEQASRFASAEVGALLGLAPITARARLAEATNLVDELPLTLACWRDGRLDRSRTMAIADRTAALDPALRREVEHRLLAEDDGLAASSVTVGPTAITGGPAGVVTRSRRRREARREGPW